MAVAMGVGGSGGDDDDAADATDFLDLVSVVAGEDFLALPIMRGCACGWLASIK